MNQSTHPDQLDLVHHYVSLLDVELSADEPSRGSDDDGREA